MPANSGWLLIRFAERKSKKTDAEFTTNLHQCTILGHSNPVLNSRK